MLVYSTCCTVCYQATALLKNAHRTAEEALALALTLENTTLAAHR